MAWARRWELWLAALIACGWRLALYLHYRPIGLGSDDLGLTILFWHADALRAQLPDWWARMSLVTAGNWPPTFAWLAGLVARLTSDPFAAGPIISAAASGAVVFVLARLTTRLTGDRWAGLAAGLFFAVAPLSVFWDAHVRAETLFVVFNFTAIYYLLAYVDGGRGRDLQWATFWGAVSSCIKYDAIVLAVVLGWCWLRHLRRGGRRDLPLALLGGLPWLVPVFWALSFGPERFGNYDRLFNWITVAQFSAWFALTIATMPVVVTWPVFLLGALGVYALGRERESRKALWVLAALMIIYLSIISVSNRWTARYQLALLPYVAVLAAVGWAHLPPPRWLKPGLAALAVLTGLLISNQWVDAEQNRWKEIADAGQALARIAGPHDRVWSDDAYLLPYWAGRDVRPLRDFSDLRAGDVLAFTDFWGALQHKRTVESSLSELGRRAHYQLRYKSTRWFTPLAGEVLDPHVLAHKRELRDLGPLAFWDRTLPVESSAVIVKVTSAP
jgi:hypothetical protein